MRPRLTTGDTADKPGFLPERGHSHPLTPHMRQSGLGSYRVGGGGGQRTGSDGLEGRCIWTCTDVLALGRCSVNVLNK